MGRLLVGMAVQRQQHWYCLMAYIHDWYHTRVRVTALHGSAVVGPELNATVSKLLCSSARLWVWVLPCTLRSVLSTAWPRGVSDILTLLSVVSVPSLPGFRSSLPYASHTVMPPCCMTPDIN